MTQERNQLKSSLSSMSQEQNQLQTSLNNMTQERNQLQTSLNSMSQEQNQLQTSLNNMTQESNQLKTSLNSTTQERNQLQTSLNNMTQERNQLQTSLNIMSQDQEQNQLQTSLNNMTQERNQLQTSLNSTTQERNQLQTSLNSMTQEKHQLQMEIERLTLKIKELTPCPDGWTHFNSSCYFNSSESKSWDESRQDCLRRGADLVIINSREENSFLKKFGLRVWIGLSDLETEGEWKWVDGSSLSYTSWAKGQPDDAPGGEDCGEVRPERDGWNDLFCTHSLHWVCEKKTPVHPVGI
uniref:C-type lectin domain-containing protein n=1 Tax=Myripristis murdjan TaxID=586833 RepID=A0A668AQ17_9TELE